MVTVHWSRFVSSPIKKDTEEHTGHNPCPPAQLDERSWEERSLGGRLSWQGVTCQEIEAGLRRESEDGEGSKISSGRRTPGE
ncbi:MAG: hypothetical protein ACFFDI_28380, partial [Promethearchaeota archaeon]